MDHQQEASDHLGDPRGLGNANGGHGFWRRIGENVLANFLWWLIGVFVVLGLSVFGIGVLGSGDGNEQQTVREEQTFKVGDTQTFGRFTVTLLDQPQCVPAGGSTTTAPATTKICTVPLRIRNNSDSGDRFSATSAIVIGRQTYQADVGDDAYISNIFPHSAEETTARVALPIGLEPEVFVLNIDFNGQKLVWTLH